MKRTFLRPLILAAIICDVSFCFADSVHEVQKGETLYSISKSYGVTVDSVKSANNFSGNDIKVGQKLKIPSGAASQIQETSKSNAGTAPSKDASKASAGNSVYEVQKGDTWFGIAKKNGITVSELQKFNESDANASLKVGQKIKLPQKKEVASNVPAAKTDSAQTKQPENKTQASQAAVIPDLKSKDPHSYSTKKADASLVWPVKTKEIVYIDGKIGGVILSAKKDELVSSIRAGTVMFSGSYRGFGNVVFIQSKTGHIYAYTGLGSIGVNKGDYINYNSQIGTAGVDAYTGKSQMSLMVFQNGQPIDPAKAPRG